MYRELYLWIFLEKCSVVKMHFGCWKNRKRKRKRERLRAIQIVLRLLLYILVWKMKKKSTDYIVKQNRIALQTLQCNSGWLWLDKKDGFLVMASPRNKLQCQFQYSWKISRIEEEAILNLKWQKFDLKFEKITTLT